MRCRGEHVYLVRHQFLELFDDRGPMEEFCVHKRGAPLVPMFPPETTRSHSGPPWK